MRRARPRLGRRGKVGRLGGRAGRNGDGRRGKGRAGCWAKSAKEAGLNLELGWKGRKGDFSKTNPFLFLILKTKPNSNQIQVLFQIYFPIQIKMNNFVRLPKINFTTLKILLFF